MAHEKTYTASNISIHVYKNVKVFQKHSQHIPTRYCEFYEAFQLAYKNTPENNGEEE